MKVRTPTKILNLNNFSGNKMSRPTRTCSIRWAKANEGKSSVSRIILIMLWLSVSF